jgi:DNA polymerase-3 subunit gamma/tau
MSYLVLARKYRPQFFEDVIGQEHITELLTKAINSGRVHHAYLFCGPRGICKTSCARILSKALNCEKGPTVKPCGQCPACTEIAKGTSFDVMEIDGASNRGIDEIRALRENVKFAPSYNRFKIYIIDEVHMLTTEAFNALLKTLEEPPPHVKFIFATTEPQKVPATIVSRCQRFDFKRVGIKALVEAMEKIAGSEGLSIDPDALFAIAKAAQGSFRDALSILDQLSALSDRDIKSDDVYSMLGLVETENLFELVDAIGKKDCGSALKTLDKIIDQGKDLKQLMRDLTDHFRNLMVIKIGGKSLGKLIDYPVAVKEMILTQTELFSIEDILAAIDAMISAQETARVTESYRIPLEVAFAMLTYTGKPAVITGSNEKPLSRTAQSPMQIVKNKKGQVDVSGTEPAVPKNIVQPGPASKPEPGNNTVDLETLLQKWDHLTHAVSRKRMSIATYLQEGVPCGIDDNEITVGFPKDCAFHKECLEEDANLKLVDSVLSEFFQSNLRVRYILTDKINTIKNEAAVDNAIDTFEGEITSKWNEDN